MSIKNIDDQTYPIESSGTGPEEITTETISVEIFGNATGTSQVPALITRLGNVISLQINQTTIKTVGASSFTVRLPMDIKSPNSLRVPTLVHISPTIDPPYMDAKFRLEFGNSEGFIEMVKGVNGFLFPANTTCTILPIQVELLVN